MNDYTRRSLKKVTIYLDSDIHLAVKAKASLNSTTISKLISEAIRDSLREDMEDIRAFEERKDEGIYSLEEVLEQLNLKN
jgi:predicted transcriptional regulator